MAGGAFNRNRCASSQQDVAAEREKEGKSEKTGSNQAVDRLVEAAIRTESNG